MKIIANQLIDLSAEEYKYYLELEKNFGKDSFFNLFKTNELGQVIAVFPSSNNPTAIILIFFFLNIMFNQRLRKLENWMKKIDNLEERLNKIEKEDLK